MNARGPGTTDPEPTGPGATDPERDDEHDTRMTGVYVAVIVLEALIITALWALGRLYS